ncbi:MAG: hypothetical protein ACFB02_10765 [Mastigocoleus sp.]
MASNQRSRRIMEHLKQSGNIQFDNGRNERSPNVRDDVAKPNLSDNSNQNSNNSQPTTSVSSTAPVTPNSYKTPDGRKKQIMDHLSRSGSGYNLLSSDSEQRKQKIQNHVRKST